MNLPMLTLLFLLNNLGLTMALGDFDNDVMGYENNMTNYILYLLFIGVMTIIILNLLVGIAVGEISQTLEAADIQQISLKITYCLKVTEKKGIVYSLEFFFSDRFKNHYNILPKDRIY